MSFLLQFAKQDISDFFDQILPKGPKARRYFEHQSDSGLLVRNREDFLQGNIPLSTKVPKFYLQHRKINQKTQKFYQKILLSF